MSNPFLKCNDTIVSYDDLYKYANEWTKSISESSDLPLIINGERSTETILKIASCWLHGIAFSVIPALASASEINRYYEGLKSVGEFDNGMDDFSLAAVLFTSGSSGTPKVVPLKRRNVKAAASASLKNFSLNPGEFWIHTLPVHHIGGISIIIRAIQSYSAILLPGDTSPNTIRECINSESAAAGVSLVPTQLRRLLSEGILKPNPNFKGILLGGGPINDNDIRSCILHNLRVIPSFGMTETAAQCMAVPFSTWQDAPPGCCGKPLYGVEAQLRPDPENLSFNLLWLRGDQIFDGYGNQDQQEFDSEGWFCTGDYARCDDDGFFYIIMRRSDRIVSGGENINPLEIEQAITATNLINGEFAVIGLPDTDWGQAVTLVTSEQNTVTLERLRHELARNLSRFKLPKSMHVFESFPKTSAGKLKRQELADAIIKQLSGAGI